VFLIFQKGYAQSFEGRNTVFAVINALSCLPQVHFQAVKKDPNRVANELAQLMKYTTQMAMWLTQVPLCVKSVVAKECIHAPE
jgi:hypothetical protein